MAQIQVYQDPNDLNQAPAPVDPNTGSVQPPAAPVAQPAAPPAQPLGDAGGAGVDATAGSAGFPSEPPPQVQEAAKKGYLKTIREEETAAGNDLKDPEVERAIHQLYGDLLRKYG